MISDLPWMKIVSYKSSIGRRFQFRRKFVSKCRSQEISQPGKLLCRVGQHSLKTVEILWHRPEDLLNKRCKTKSTTSFEV